jgi:SAM-dependent methyltransferase
VNAAAPDSPDLPPAAAALTLPAPAPRDLPTRDGYDLWADIYDADANPLVLLESRYIPALLGDPRGLSILDLGCGTGRHSLPLAAAGATVTGVDFSEGMLAQARSKSGANIIHFIRHDLAAPLPLPAAAFDRVLCCLVLDHISDLAGVFSEMRRVCRPDGSVVVSIMHPAMMLKGVQARFTDPRTGVQTRPASIPNRICDYIAAILRAGLRIDTLQEHDADEALTAQTPRAARYLGWPMLLTMRLLPSP